MSALSIGLIVVAVMGVVSVVLAIRESAQRRRQYAAKVGLDLQGLVALLPAHLRHRSYSRYLLAPYGPHISVGLVYQAQGMREGNPLNVGLDFDAETGALVAIHEEGIGLGFK